MKNFRSSLILALVVAGLFGFLLFGNRHIQSTAQREQAALFPDFDPDKADFLRITDPDGVVEVRKKDGVWSVTAPVATEADSPAISGVLQSLAGLRALRVIPLSDVPKSAETLQSWQLVPGTVRAEFGAPGFSGLLRIGRKTAVSDLIYACASATADAPVLLLPASSRDEIDKKLSDLRSRVALRFDPAEVVQCGLRGAAPAGGGAATEFQLERSGGNGNGGGKAGAEPKAAPSWKLQKPLSADADAGRVQAWLRALAGLRIRQFVSDDASDLTAYGLNTPVSQIWVQAPARGGSAAKAPETLLIGLPVPGTPAGSQGQVYAKRLAGNAVFTLAAADVDRLVHDLPETRDRKVAPFAAASAVAVKVETGLDGKGPSRTVAAHKDDGKGTWTFDAAAGIPGQADSNRIGDFLQSLSTLEAAQIVSDIASDLKPYGLDRPSARITVSLKKENGGPESVTLLLGKPVPAPAPAKDGKPEAKAPAPALFAKNAALPFIYAIPSSVADGLPREAWQWLDPRAVPPGLDPAKIDRLTVTPDSATPFHLTRTPQGDFQTDAPGATVAPAKAAAQVALLAALRAERWLGPPQPAFGLAKPRWKIVVESGGAPVYTLLLGAELPGGASHAAQIEGQPYAFALSGADDAVLAAQPFAAAGSPPASAPAATSPH